MRSSLTLSKHFSSKRVNKALSLSLYHWQASLKGPDDVVFSSKKSKKNFLKIFLSEVTAMRHFYPAQQALLPFVFKD